MDLIVRNGLVVDGTGGLWFRSDVLIGDGRLDSFDVDVVFDADGLIVSPGFIVIHSYFELTLLADPRAESYVRQGITTIVNGNCGCSPASVSGMAAERLRGLTQRYGFH